jgi:hypothetical protein
MCSAANDYVSPGMLLSALLINALDDKLLFNSLDNNTQNSIGVGNSTGRFCRLTLDFKRSLCFCSLDHAFSNYDEKTNEMHFQSKPYI